MKSFVILISLFFFTPNSLDITEVRNSYRYAKKSAENTEKFYQITKKTNYKTDNVLSAYYGCALTLKASFAEKTGDKISFFKKGKKLIESAITLEPDNIELRMIRLSVQTSAPRITRYYKNIESDKKFLQDNINKVSSSKLKEFVKGFISTSKAFTE